MASWFHGSPDKGDQPLNFTSIMSEMTLEDKIGQLLMVPPQEDVMRRVRAGTVIVMDQHIDSERQGQQFVADLQQQNAQSSRVPLWIHGFVYQKEWAGPRDGVIAEGCTVEQAEECCFELGRRWRSIGFHTYPSPTVNVPKYGECIMRDWAISSDPHVTDRYARAITRGLIRAGCGTMAQHFPAHGATPVDSHVDIPTIEMDIEELMRDHIPPYSTSFAAGCTTICTAHVRCPALDSNPEHIATISRPILTDFLRGQLAFQGVTIADSITMEGFKRIGDLPEKCVEAVAAGCDSICITQEGDLAERVFGALLQAVGDGRLTDIRLEEAVQRNLSFKQWLQETAAA